MSNQFNIKDVLQKISFDKFISIDLETTGLNVNQDEIIEISAIKFINGQADSDFTTFVKPKKQIPKQITELTGISNKMVEDAPLIEDVLDDFISFIDGSILVAHNIEFDLSFINRVIDENQKDINIDNICDTLLLSRSFLFNLEKFNLEYLSLFFDLDIKNSHRAKFDALNTGNILIKLIQQMISIPLKVHEKINQLNNRGDIYNHFLYLKIYEFLKLNTFDTYSSVEPFILRDNILDNTISGIDDFSDNIDSWLGENGKLSKVWSDYSKRDIQEIFCSDIYLNFQSNSIMVAEAGAGLGKSLAYLISGLKYAKENNKKLIISTYTKALQEQLFYKDIPVLIDYLNLNLKAIILKGKNNYISKNNLNRIIDNYYINMDVKDINECITLIVWSHFTKTGDVEECNGVDRERINRLWSKLSYSGVSELDLYKNQYEIFSQNDYYNKIIKEADNSDIIIINHSLLCNDVSSDSPNLPLDSLLIIDEGHNLINAIQNKLTSTFSDVGFTKTIKLTKKIIQTIKYDDLSVLDKINITLDSILKNSKQVFDLFKYSFEDSYLSLQYGSRDLLLSNEEFKLNGFDLNSIYSDLDKLESLIESILDQKKKLIQLQLILFEISELKSISEIFSKNKSNYIKWISIYKRGFNNYFKVYVSNSNTKEFMLDKLYGTYSSFLMCSATFTINNSFDFLFNKFGFSKNDFIDLKTKIYKSPFYYEDQSKFYIYNKSIDINSDNYINDVSNQIAIVSKSLCKRMLILCTSYKQVKAISKNLVNNFNLDENNIFTQTSKYSKKNLLDKYKSSNSGILVATATFWEGIDLKGDLLEILFIVRIPFVNPSNPYNYYLSNKIESEGGNSFYDLQLPNAILKLKQGVGRLIRSDKDSGVCIMTDPRISQSRYGKFILDELSLDSEFYIDIKEIINDIDNFLG